MLLQQWRIIKITDGKRKTLGQVTTTADADKNVALAKACRKFYGGQGISVGWHIEAEKSFVVDMGR